MSDKPTPDPKAVLEQTAWVEDELWANSMRACVAKDLRRALDATLSLKPTRLAGKNAQESRLRFERAVDPPPGRLTTRGSGRRLRRDYLAGRVRSVVGRPTSRPFTAAPPRSTVSPFRK